MHLEFLSNTIQHGNKMSIKAPKHKRINPFPPWSLSLRHKSLSVQNGSREVCMGLKIFWGFLIKVLKRRFSELFFAIESNRKGVKVLTGSGKKQTGSGGKGVWDLLRLCLAQ